MIEYVAFNPPRKLEEFMGQLPAMGYEAIADAKLRGGPTQYVVRGEWRDGSRRWLDLAVDRAWIETRTNYRQVDGRLRWVCPQCGSMSGKHTRLCGYEA